MVRCNSCATPITHDEAMDWESETGVVVKNLCSECFVELAEIGVY